MHKNAMNKKLPIVCASIDAIFTIIIMIVIAAFDGKTPIDLVTRYQGFLFIVLIISLVAGWRGHADANRILSDARSWSRPARDGFIIGFIPLPVSHAIGILQEAIAAGPPWPTLGYSSITEWLKYVAWMFGWSILFGGIGALYGLLLSGINRMLVKKFFR